MAWKKASAHHFEKSSAKISDTYEIFIIIHFQ